MKRSFFRVFFSKNKEKEWLNKMGKLGYLLVSANDSVYKFEHNDCEYSYSVEYLNCPPNSVEAEEYFKQQEQKGIQPLLASGNWVYFVSSEIQLTNTPDACKMNARFYFWKSLYFMFFASALAMVCGYQAFAYGYLELIGHEGNGLIREFLSTDSTGGTFSGLLNVLKSIVNFLGEILNSYFSLWTGIFGENDAIMVISIIAPIAFVLYIFAALNINEYLIYRSQLKRLKLNSKVLEGEDDAEQAV